MFALARKIAATTAAAGDAADKGTGNSRNGYSDNTVLTEDGEIDIAVPRERNATFEPQIVSKGARRIDVTAPPSGTCCPRWLSRLRQLVCKAVIDVAVPGLVSPHQQDDIAQTCIFRKLPIADRKRRSSNILVASGVNLLEIKRIAEYRLLLEITNRPMRSAWREHVEHEVCVVEDPLSDQDEPALERRWFGDLDEGHQVHAFVLRFIEQCAYPAPVIADMSETAQVLEEPTNHPGHCRDGLENDGPMAISLGKEPVGQDS